MKLKVCGMKHNTVKVVGLQPDYLGFIFSEKSPRFFNEEIVHLPESIKKVGVFVNASIEEIIQKIFKYKLDAIQLHGEESADYCRLLKKTISDSYPNPQEIIKVFSIKDTFDFNLLKVFEDACDYYLFDTKGKLPGGNGYTFDWSVLKDYSSTKPYFLSGGIGLNEVDSLKVFFKSSAGKYCYAVDVNSKFEIHPGLKDIKKLAEFKSQL